MAKLNVPNHFASVDEARSSLGIVLPKPHVWRLLNPAIIGEINGIATIRGTAVATNGIHVLLMTEKASHIGHFDWFVADEVVNDKPAKAVGSGRTARSTMPTENIFAGFWS